MESLAEPPTPSVLLFTLVEMAHATSGNYSSGERGLFHFLSTQLCSKTASSAEVWDIFLQWKQRRQNVISPPPPLPLPSRQNPLTFAAIQSSVEPLVRRTPEQLFQWVLILHQDCFTEELELDSQAYASLSQVSEVVARMWTSLENPVTKFQREQALRLLIALWGMRIRGAEDQKELGVRCDALVVGQSYVIWSVPIRQGISLETLSESIVTSRWIARGKADLLGRYYVVTRS